MPCMRKLFLQQGSAVRRRTPASLMGASFNKYGIYILEGVGLTHYDAQPRKTTGT